MKRVLCLALVLTIVCALLTFMPANAATIIDSGDCGYFGNNLTWSLDNSGTLRISGNGEMQNSNTGGRYSGPLPWLDYSNEIYNVVIDYGVTNIGDESFYNCVNLKRIDIPNSVKTID